MNRRTGSAPLPTARANPGSAVEGTRAYLLGGGNANGAMNSVLQYDAALDSWITLTNTLPAVRRSGASGLINGKIYFAQGYGNGVLASMDAYAVPKTVYLCEKQ